MAIKKIVVPVPDVNTGAGALMAALALGRDFNAQVVALHVRPDARDAVLAFTGNPIPPPIMEKIISSSEERAARTAEKVLKLFNETCAQAKVEITSTAKAPNSVSASFIDVTGSEKEELRKRGRLADLVVIARPRGELAASQRLTLEAALIDTGRPLLVVPPKGAAHVGGNVAIAWNGSAQAARAVGMAMDFLTTASMVTILTAKEGDRDYRPSDLMDYLAAHGVSAKVAQVPASENTGKALVSAAVKSGAGLLVMGAYGHSRLREMVLGGVTKYVLQETTIPTLMVH